MTTYVFEEKINRSILLNHFKVDIFNFRQLVAGELFHF